MSRLLPPLGSQEVWAAGVTYYRSRTARMEEAKSAGGGDFYDRVYAAARPELFFKATPHRVVAARRAVSASAATRSWNVPEPELTLVVTARGADRRLHHRQRHELAATSRARTRSICRRPRSTTAAARSGPACSCRDEPLPPRPRAFA